MPEDPKLTMCWVEKDGKLREMYIDRDHGVTAFRTSDSELTVFVKGVAFNLTPGEALCLRKALMHCGLPARNDYCGYGPA